MLNSVKQEGRVTQRRGGGSRCNLQLMIGYNGFLFFFSPRWGGGCDTVQRTKKMKYSKRLKKYFLQREGGGGRDPGGMWGQDATSNQ